MINLVSANGMLLHCRLDFVEDDGSVNGLSGDMSDNHVLQNLIHVFRLMFISTHLA